MLTPDDKLEIKETIQNSVQGYNARIESSYNIIELKLESIDNHLSKLNGKVAKHEEELIDVKLQNSITEEGNKTRDATCPHIDKINELNKESYGRRKVIRFALTSLSVVSVALAILVAIMKLDII